MDQVGLLAADPLAVVDHLAVAVGAVAEEVRPAAPVARVARAARATPVASLTTSTQIIQTRGPRVSIPSRNCLSICRISKSRTLEIP